LHELISVENNDPQYPQGIYRIALHVVCNNTNYTIYMQPPWSKRYVSYQPDDDDHTGIFFNEIPLN